MTRRSLARLIVGVVFSFACGCGYHLGMGTGMPEGVESISVALFENRSGENRMPHLLSSHLTYELTRRGMHLASTDDANAVIRGRIRSIRTETVSWGGSDSRERRLTVVADARLVGRDGNVLRTVSGISADRTHVVLPSKSATERSRLEALDDLARRLAENVYEALMDRF